MGHRAIRVLAIRAMLAKNGYAPWLKPEGKHCKADDIPTIDQELEAIGEAIDIALPDGMKAALAKINKQGGKDNGGDK